MKKQLAEDIVHFTRAYPRTDFRYSQRRRIHGPRGQDRRRKSPRIGTGNTERSETINRRETIVLGKPSKNIKNPVSGKGGIFFTAEIHVIKIQC